MRVINNAHYFFCNWINSSFTACLSNQVSWRSTLSLSVLTGHPVQKHSIFICPGIKGKWLLEYNCEHPHKSLNNMTLEEYWKHHYLVRLSKMHKIKAGLFTIKIVKSSIQHYILLIQYNTSINFMITFLSIIIIHILHTRPDH